MAASGGEGETVKVHFFCMDLPHSNAAFVKAYPTETAEAFLDGHVSAFGFFGGVPQSVLYDNTRLTVARLLPDVTRERTRFFIRLISHYAYKDRFGCHLVALNDGSACLALSSTDAVVCDNVSVPALKAQPDSFAFF